MARVELPNNVTKVVGGNLQPLLGASVAIQHRGTGTTATVYGAESGGTTISNPVVTDADGRIEGWVDEGSYNLVVSGSGISTYTARFEAVRGDGVSNLAPGAVGTSHLANGAVTPAKLSPDIASTIMPTGTILAYAGTVAPAGWVFTNGALYNGHDPLYVNLWNTIGTRFGGTGQGSFAVPDTRGNVLVGADATSGRGPTYSVGDTGGSNNHTHNFTAPQHTHSAGIPNHEHFAGGLFLPNHGHHIDFGSGAESGSTFVTQLGGGTLHLARGGHFHGITGDTFGSGNLGIHGTTHGMTAGQFTITSNARESLDATTRGADSRQPYVVVNYIIRL